MQSESKKFAPVAQTHELLARSRRDLDVFTHPSTVAVVGATETPASVGRTLLSNLLASPFGGAVYPVNPHRPSVLGVPAYSSLSAVPVAIDLAVIAVPAAAVPESIRECVELRVGGAIIISAGFAETGAAGADLEARIRELCAGSSMRVVGPNCLGVMAPRSGLNATFAAGAALPGKVGFLSQSGALLTAILDWSLEERIGFSAFVSLGSMLDVSWGDWIEYLGDDPYTESIVIYMESIGDPRSFLSAARSVALRKPIIVLKAGRTPEAAKAAASHTGVLTGRDEVLDAAFRRVGVLRVESIADLFSMAEVLAKHPRPQGPRLTIMTNAGGPGILATDALLKHGGRLAQLSPETVAQLDRILPEHWSRDNPVDILGDADAERYARTFEVLDHEPRSDGQLVILTPQAMTDPVLSAERLRSVARSSRKPVLASWMGGSTVAGGRAVLAGSNVALFDYPEAAVQAFVYMWRYSDNLRALYETPSEVSEAPAGARERVERSIAMARSAGRTLLGEVESKEIIAAYGIPTVETHIASSPREAIALAERIGFPVVVKLVSPTVIHKSDVDGVRLNLTTSADVEKAFAEIEASTTAKVGPDQFDGVTVQKMIRGGGYELIIGCSVDEQFGPVLLFGAGGIAVEVFRDLALGLPPLNTTLARRVMERTRIVEAMTGARGKSIDLQALEHLLVRFSQLVVDHPAVHDIEINPLLASRRGLVAVDARVVLHENHVHVDRLPRPVIRPYPSHYNTTFALRNGAMATIRAIRPEDEPLLVRFHGELTAETVYRRYAHLLSLSQRVAHERLAGICFVDYDRDIVLVVEVESETHERQIVAVGRLVRFSGNADRELALLVSDAFQRQGVGRRLLEQLIETAKEEGVRRVVASIAPDNLGMRRLCQKFGFDLHPKPGGLFSVLTLQNPRGDSR